MKINDTYLNAALVYTTEALNENSDSHTGNSLLHKSVVKAHCFLEKELSYKYGRSKFQVRKVLRLLSGNNKAYRNHKLIKAKFALRSWLEQHSIYHTTDFYRSAI